MIMANGRMSEQELRDMEYELCQRLGGEIEVVATADFATRALGRALSEIRTLHREKAELQAAKNRRAA